DMQRAVQHDVTAAYDAYETTRTSVGLSVEALAAARESFRIQQTRYQSGATTILDLVDAEVNLSQAEADYVAARYGTRLALAGLEAVQSIELRPEVQGRITDIVVREGQEVAAGTALFRVDDAELKAQVAQAEAERQMARQALERTKQLIAQNASSASDLEQAQAKS